MTLYKVIYKDKHFFYRANSALEAFEKFERRKVFGRFIIWGYNLDLVDADTRGRQWARFFNDEEMTAIMVNLVASR